MKKTGSSVTIYTAKSKIRHPLLLLKEMQNDLLRSRVLAWRLIVRDISAQYRQTLLGYFWAVFPPLVTTLVFVILNSSKVVNIKVVGIPYPAYVMAGTVFWQLFVDGLNAPLKIVTESKALLTKINLPKESLVLSGIGQVLFSFGIKVILLAGVLILYKVPVNWTLIILPLPIIGLLLLGIMLGVFLIPIGILYKDIQSALLIGTSGMVFLSPVAYPPSVGGILGDIMRINPVTPLLQVAKELLFTGMPSDFFSLFLVLGLTLLFLFIGWVIYRLALPIIIERIGA